MIWLGFQRAVNVGGRAYPMAECRAALEAAGFTGVQTYIQTGNVRVESPMRSAAKVERALERVFAEDRGFVVETLVFRPAELIEIAHDTDQILAQHVAQHGEPTAHYVELLRAPLAAAAEAVVHEGADEGTHYVVRGRAVHLLAHKPFNEIRAPTVALKRAYGVSTNRNARVIRAIADKWC